MKILVIGGSYFYGRVFVMLAAEKHSITVVNRGTYSMEEFGVRQIKGDRHDPALWKSCGEDYDAVVDFCAYEPGDIRTVLENLPGAVRQYILISTVDIYRRQGENTDAFTEEVSDGKEKGLQGETALCAGNRGNAALKDEDTPWETRRFPGEAGAYIAGKTALERELRKVCGAKGAACTVLRPAILYGPYNYAPRESAFIQLAVRQGVLPRFTDASGRFQFLYVKDGAEAVLKCLGNEKTFGRAYNLCGNEILDYDLFFRELAACAQTAQESTEAVKEIAETTQEGAGESGVLREVTMTLAEAGERGIPIPFPATREETELVSNARSKTELGMEYIPFREGMKKTYTAFRHVYEQ